MQLSNSFLEIATYIVRINVLLAFFNMIPFPPLDGSKILMALLPYGPQMQYRNFVRMAEQYGMIFLFLFLFVFYQFIATPFSGFIYKIVNLLTGM